MTDQIYDVLTHLAAVLTDVTTESMTAEIA